MSRNFTDKIHMLASVTDTICNSFIITTSDGTLIVIDGGYDSETAHFLEKTAEILKTENSSAYVYSGGLAVAEKETNSLYYQKSADLICTETKSKPAKSLLSPILRYI